MLYRVYRPWRRVKGLRGLTDEQARQVWRPFSGENIALGFTHAAVCLTAWYVVMAGLLLLMAVAMPTPHPAVEAIFWFVTAATLVAAFVGAYALTFRAVAAEAVRDTELLLRTSCGACGYTLVGLPESTQRCPECGGPVADLVRDRYDRMRRRERAMRR